MITDIPTEQTTAFTDVLLAVLAMLAIGMLRPRARVDRFKVAVWSWVFALLALAATLGAAAHGLDIPPAVRTVLWQPLFLALGVLVGLFVVASVYDLRGRQAALRLLPLMLGLAVVFYGLTRVFEGMFRVFVIYEAVAMIVALLIYLALTRSGRQGAGTIAVAIVINIAAAAIQESERVSVSWIWELDHNGLFHLVQMVAVIVLVTGLRSSLAAPRGTSAGSR